MIRIQKEKGKKENKKKTEVIITEKSQKAPISVGDKKFRWKFPSKNLINMKIEDSISFKS